MTIALLVVLVASTLHSVALGFIASEAAEDIAEEEDCESTGQCIQQQVREHFGDTLFDSLRDERQQEVAANLGTVLERHGGFRIKVYDETGIVLWSDESRLIGRAFPDNQLLKRAIGGKIVSKIGKPEEKEHEYERGAARYVREIYVPIYSQDRRLLGVVELYRESDETVARIARIRTFIWTGAAIGTLILCSTLALTFRWSHRRILRLQDELRSRGDDLAKEKSKLDAVVEGVGVGLWMIDRDHRVAWANQKMSEILGTSGDLVGRECFRASHNRTAPCEGCTSARALATGCEARAERTHVGPEGRERHLQIAAWPVRDPSGAATHTLELIQDVTDRAELESQMRQASKLASVGELAGGVAHEINNPAGVILATSTHLLDREPPPELRPSLNLIASNAMRISRITSALLAFSRKSEGSRRLLPINRVVEDALLLAGRRTGTGIQLARSLSPDLPEVLANENEIQQVIINLTNNACDAMPDGGTLRIATRSAGAERVAIEVTDSGSGIPAQHLDRIFEPFFTTKPEWGGTGLGLAISHRIVTSHGGLILVRSTPGRGSTFIVELPAHREGGK